MLKRSNQDHSSSPDSPLRTRMNATSMRRITTSTPICVRADELNDDLLSSSASIGSFVSSTGSFGSVVDETSTVNERVLEFMFPDASELLTRRVLKDID